MDNLAKEMDAFMARLERAGMSHCAPKLNKESDPSKWLSDTQAPWKKLDNENPKGETVAYAALLSAWKDGKVRENRTFSNDYSSYSPKARAPAVVAGDRNRVV